MSAVHLVRHGEVFNPDRVIYERLPHFRLSERGEAMAALTANAFADRPIVRLIASPLLRTQQSARPWSELFELPVETDERVIEAGNELRGRRGGRALATDPANWKYFRNPLTPSWGEPFRVIAARMAAAVKDALATPGDGEVAIVSHQLPIWMVHRSLAGLPLAHDPAHRRCALSSVTTVAFRDGRYREIAYADPAAPLLRGAVDAGAT